MDVKKIDVNFADKNLSDKPGVVWYDIRKSPFTIYGLYDPKNQPVFRRMPLEIAESVSPGVAYLSGNTSGGRVRFSTDSPYIAIRASMPEMCYMNHMATTGSCGFEIYLDNENGTEMHISSFVPPANATNGYVSYVDIIYSDVPEGMNSYTVYFPLYSGVNAVEIGIEKGYILEKGKEYRPIAPIVYYGSSITQGGCASKPGNSYQGFLCRDLDVDFINLGFSGAARGEKNMAEYIASLEMSMFVCDYDHNEANGEELSGKHYAFYETIRKARPTLPILLVSKPDVFLYRSVAAERRDVIRETYERAVSNGDKYVDFLDGFTLLGSGNDASDCLVDAIHPNDLGFWRMAQAMKPFIQKHISHN